jgi:hypothetical protein
MSNAIVWSENHQPESVGQLELIGRGLCLESSGEDQARQAREVHFDDLVDVFVERCSPPKHAWEPALVLVTREGDRVAIGSVADGESVYELADEIISAYRKTQAA